MTRSKNIRLSDESYKRLCGISELFGVPKSQALEFQQKMLALDFQVIGRGKKKGSGDPYFEVKF